MSMPERQPPYSPSETGLSVVKEYRISDEARSRLDKYVDRLEIVSPSRLITPKEISVYSQGLNMNRLEEGLLSCGLSPEDFEDAVWLAALTECATFTYADQFYKVSRKYNQPWLGRFTEKVWVPDELMHTDPFTNMLLQMGNSQEKIDAKIKRAQNAKFTIGDNDTPVQASDFGMNQEKLTDHWYELIANVAEASGSPEAAKITRRVKQRETYHMVWYKDMTAVQVEDNPNLIEQVAETSAAFQLPGNEVAPYYQAKATDLIVRMGADIPRLKKDIYKLSAEAVGGAQKGENVGMLILKIAEENGMHIAGPLKPEQIIKAFNAFPGGQAGYGLLGESLLEVAGIIHFSQESKNPVEQIRGVFRRWVGRQIDNNFNKAFKIPEDALR